MNTRTMLRLGSTAANLILATASASAVRTAFAFSPPSRSSLASPRNFNSFSIDHDRDAPRPTVSSSHLPDGGSSARRRRKHRVAASSENDAATVSSDSISSSFKSLGLSDDLISVAQRMNWEVPTPVQQLAIPAILNMADDDSGGGDAGEGSSLWCEGPTGSGKTGGFALPLLQILMQQKRDYYATDGQGRISTLVLCPTRELAAQTGTVLQRLASYLPGKRNLSDEYHRGRDATAISIDVIHGGVPMEPQVARLARRRRSGACVDVLVATPGRLVDVLRRSDDEDPTTSALERRITDALDGKSKGGEASLSLKDIQEMDLDRVDDDGRATLDEMLRQLDYLVVDEADRLLGGAFKDDMNELLSLFPNSRGASGGKKLKTLLFSATFPEEIEGRVDRVLQRIAAGVPLRVSTSAAMRQRTPSSDENGEPDEGGDDGEELSNRQKKHLAVTTPIMNVLPDTAPKIQHRVIRLDERDRTQALRLLLDQNEDTMDRVLVFVATRYSSEHVSRKLRRYDIAAAELHGKLDQEARERRLGAFRKGKTRVLVCTDLAARGIDVEGLPAVVNYDLPRSAAGFTHRTGRTGRAGKTGTAISFVSASSESHFAFIERKELPRRIEREVLPEFPPKEARWEIESAAATMSVPGATHSQKGLEHDRMFGGIKSRRKSKKDKLREAAAASAKAKQEK